MTRAEALKKIKKLLSLSNSSNPHEAAAAMRQANAMITLWQASAAEIGDVEDEGLLRRGSRVGIGLAGICEIIAWQYGAIFYACNDRVNHTVRFASDLPGTAQVCIYNVEVLLRQLNKDRVKHLSRVKKAKNRAARGDLFERGWANGLAISCGYDCTKNNAPHSSKLQKYKTSLGLGSTALVQRAASAATNNDRYAGLCAGSTAKVNAGVGGESAKVLELSNGLPS